MLANFHSEPSEKFGARGTIGYLDFGYKPLLKSEVAIASLFSQIQQPDIILLDVKTIIKLPGNGIAESVKFCNLHQKDKILWF